jgi:hypothetical protein
MSNTPQSSAGDSASPKPSAIQTNLSSSHSSSSDLTPDAREAAPSGDFMSWLLLGGPDSLDNTSLSGDPSFDPIPVDQGPVNPNMYAQKGMPPMQGVPMPPPPYHQHPPPPPHGYPPSQPVSSSSTVVDTQTQDQLRQLQQMMAMQQDMLMRISQQQGIAFNNNNNSNNSGNMKPPPPPSNNRSSNNKSPTPQQTSSSSTTNNTSSNDTSVRVKKVLPSDSEKKLAELKAENASLKRHLDTSSKKHVRVKEEKLKAIDTMELMVKKLRSNPAGEVGVGYDTTPAGLYKFIKSYTDMYSDYGTSRSDELEFHLAQLSRLVMPTTTTKMGLWTLEQDDKFFNNIQKGSLAGILARELMISAAQMKKIIEHRGKIRSITKSLKRTLELLGQLKTLSLKKHATFKDRMEKCTKILEPVQVLKLLLWVQKHEGELKDLCPGWGSEQVLPEKDLGVSKTHAPKAGEKVEVKVEEDAGS